MTSIFAGDPAQTQEIRPDPAREGGGTPDPHDGQHRLVCRHEAHESLPLVHEGRPPMKRQREIEEQIRQQTKS